MRRFYLLSAMLALAPFRSHSLADAQSVDVSARVSEMLKGYGVVPFTHDIQVQKTLRHCTPCGEHGDCQCYDRTVYQSIKTTDNVILSGSDIRVNSSSEVTFGQPISTELPEKISVVEGSAQNCGRGPATQTLTLSETFQRSASLTVTSSVTHSAASNLNFGFRFGPGQELNIGGQLTITDSSTSGTASLSATQSSTTFTQTGSITIQPHSSVLAELRVWPVHYEVPFSATVTVDAALSPNDRGLSRLSQIIPVQQRTFPITGVLTADDAAQGKLVFFDMPYDASTCVKGKKIIKRIPFEMPVGQKTYDHIEK